MRFRLPRFGALQVTLGAALVAPGCAVAQGAVGGVAWDSLAARPLAGATVQLVSQVRPGDPPLEVVADSIGRWRVERVPAGRYLIGLQHARFDALGIDGVVETVDVPAGGPPIRVELALPGAVALVRALCGPGADSAGVVLGRVRDGERGTLAGRGTVFVQWGELTVEAGVRTVQRVRRAPIGADGRYLACGVPVDVGLALRATVGDAGRPPEASSGAIEVRFAQGIPLVQRDLLVAPLADSAASAPPTGPGLAALPTLRRGTARLTGTVRDAAGQPIAGARVAVREARAIDSIAVTDAQGAFQLSRLPAGTYPVAASALGYVIAEGAVDLRPGEAATLALTLTALTPTLARVEVRSDVDDATGFNDRLRRGVGNFVTREQIVQRGAMTVGQALLTVPTLRVTGSPTPGQMSIRGRGNCRPRFFVDGAPAPVATDEDLNALVPVPQIGGIEVYADGAGAPARFDPQGCVSVVIWSRKTGRERRP
jgi:hypothetical protein